jgi:hypothetical protein
MRLVTSALRVLLVIAATYPLWGVAYEIVTGYWPRIGWPHGWITRGPRLAGSAAAVRRAEKARGLTADTACGDRNGYCAGSFGAITVSQRAVSAGFATFSISMARS